jgi:hypothetical protein
MKDYSITFCTVSMNRLHHLKETLPANIRDNEDYPNIKFLVLDYNSGDGMKDWILSEMKEYIDRGILEYYRNEEHDFFNRSHSRNLIFNLAQSDLVCNVDADNFTGKGFATFLNETFNRESDILMTFDYNVETEAYKDAFGRFCARREDFHAVGGYDEFMTSYGYEDMDLYSRLTNLGRKNVRFAQPEFIRSISHSDDERRSKEFFANNLLSYYVSYGIRQTKVLFLYKDNTFETGTLTDQDQYYPGLFTINEGDWLPGKYCIDDTLLQLFFDSGKELELKGTGNGLFYNMEEGSVKTTFFRIEDPRFLEKIKAEYSLMSNVSRMKINTEQNRVRVNKKGYGSGMVYKNFSPELQDVVAPGALINSD